MGLSMLQRKPDSGLGNIRASPADPSRNIDWVLLLAQGAADRHRAASSSTRPSYPHVANPYLFVTRQVIFVIVAVIAMVVVMSFDYDWCSERARSSTAARIMLLVLVLLLGAVSGGARC